jgi:tetratricopeptide (TPR) repeat protein
MRTILSLSLLALVLGATRAVSAQGAEPTPAHVRTAAEAFDKGREAYKAEEYVDAAEQFEKADNNAPSSAAIELAIRARDKAGELDRAATLLALALKRHPADENLQKLSGDIFRRAGEKLFELSATCDQACDLTLAGKIVHGPPDTQRTLYVAPGALTVRAGWSDNRSDSKQVQAEAGAKGEVTFVAPTTAAAASMSQEPNEPAPEPLPVDATRDEGPTKKSAGLPPAVFFVGAGLTVVAGGITIWSGIDTVSNPGADAVKKECMGQGEDCALYQEGLGKQQRTNVLIAVTAGLAAVTVVIGAVATNWSGGKGPAETAKLLRLSLDVAPWASHEGGGLQAFGRF